MFKAQDYLISIIEMESFTKDAIKVFSEQEREALTDFLAANPHYGDIIQGTGGVRKIRWAAKGSGKRGGARVIYYFRDLNMPVFLIAVYAKGQKANLTASERALAKALVDQLVKQYMPRWENILRHHLGAS